MAIYLHNGTKVYKNTKCDKSFEFGWKSWLPPDLN